MSEKTAQPAPEKSKGWGTGTKVLLGIVLLIVVIGVLAVITLTVNVIGSSPGTSFPFSTNYQVTLPDGEPVTMGNSHILVMTMNGSVDTSVDGTKETLAVGQERVISPHHAEISALGIPLLDTDFQITLKYLGETTSGANFYMTVKTSKQIPEMVIRRLIPANMNAQPV